MLPIDLVSLACKLILLPSDLNSLLVLPIDLVSLACKLILLPSDLVSLLVFLSDLVSLPCDLVSLLGRTSLDALVSGRSFSEEALHCG